MSTIAATISPHLVAATIITCLDLRESHDTPSPIRKRLQTPITRLRHQIPTISTIYQCTDLLYIVCAFNTKPWIATMWSVDTFIPLANTIISIATRVARGTKHVLQAQRLPLRAGISNSKILESTPKDRQSAAYSPKWILSRLRMA